MSERCCHEECWPETRTDPACGRCLLDREEYYSECEGCTERYGRDDYDEELRI